MTKPGKQYRRQRRRQVLVSVMGVAGTMIYVFLAYGDGWSLYIAFSVIAGMGLFTLMVVRRMALPILCPKCDREMTWAYHNAEVQNDFRSNEVKFCPYCGCEINEQHNNTPQPEATKSLR